MSDLSGPKSHKLPRARLPPGLQKAWCGSRKVVAQPGVREEAPEDPAEKLGAGRLQEHPEARGPRLPGVRGGEPEAGAEAEGGQADLQG